MRPLYEPLNSLNSEIRLLEIVALNHGVVSCNLFPISLEEKPTFAALSYVWGDSNIVENITVNGHVVSVTKNLASALRHVRNSWAEHFPDRDLSTFRLWADAICINQRDIPERNSQVQQMGSLYATAEVVLAWLGEGWDGKGDRLELGVAFTLFQKIALKAVELANNDKELFKLQWLEQQQELYAEDLPSRDLHNRNSMWRAANAMLELPYWYRAWIFQEAALSKKLLLCTVGVYCDFEYLDVAIFALSKIETEIREGRLQRPKFLTTSVWATFGHIPEWFTRIGQISLVRTRQLSSNPTVISPYLRWLTSTFGRKFRAKDPKDHIYALLGITMINILPQYDENVPTRQVYRDYVAAWLKEFYSSPQDFDRMNGELYFLLHAGIGGFNNPLELPTWAPNFPEYSQYPFMTLEGLGNHSDINRLFPSPAAPAAIINYILRCEGIQVDKITRLSDAGADAWLNGSMIRFFKDFVSRYPRYVSDVHPLQAFLRAVTMNGGEVVDESFLRQSLAFLSVGLQAVVKSMRFTLANLGMNTAKGSSFNEVFLDNVFPEYRGPVRDWAALLPAAFVGLRQVSLTPVNGKLSSVDDILPLLLQIKGYRILETSSGYLGLTLEKTMLGDVICILKGCEVPVVLRKEGGQYIFVNASFIIGLGNGGMGKYVEANRQNIRTFYIR